jgi:NADH-ubiquinone oxidoreductase chain 5
MNRVGDSIFILRILLFSNYFLRFYSFSSFLIMSPYSFFTLFFLGLAFRVKTAIFPFSPWLPIAISAPTPISSLVHSSTLVTAGLYLFFRFSYYFFSFPFLMLIFIFLRVFTSFYAGASAYFEIDFKKLVALSTLSHLGFILIRFRLGASLLSFFHLLSHALFKSLLFIRLGGIIGAIRHSQDSRYISSCLNFSPMSSYFILISLINLLGVPRMTGFFSKDLILEIFHFSNFSYFIYFIVIINVGFTYMYTYKLIRLIFSSSLVSPFIVFSKFSFLESFFLALLSLFSIFSGFLFINFFLPIFEEIFILRNFKFVPLCLNFLFFFLLLWVLSIKLFNLNFKKRLIVSNMMFLTTFYSSLNKYILEFSEKVFFSFTISYLIRELNSIHTFSSELVKNKIIHSFYFI